MQLKDLRDLYQHMEWADASVWQAVFKSESASSDEKLRGLFHHLHLVQRAFLRAWRGEGQNLSFPTFEDARSLMAWGRSYYPELRAHFAELTEDGIAEEMQVPWAEIVTRQLGRSPERITVAETLMQVPLHSLYHRGQVNARLRAIGGEPATVDYIVWTWLGRPAARWEE